MDYSGRIWLTCILSDNNIANNKGRKSILDIVLGGIIITLDFFDPQ